MSLSRETVCDYIRENHEVLRERAKARFIAYIDSEDVEAFCRRFLKAGAAYGDFDINAIDVYAELPAEAQDFLLYETIRELQCCK